jgi:hypothetical protein
MMTVEIGTEVSNVSVGRLTFNPCGVGLGDTVGTGDGVAVGGGVGLAVGGGVGVPVGAGVGVSVGAGVGVSVGAGVAVGVSVGLAVGAGDGVGDGVDAVDTNAKPRLSELDGSWSLMSPTRVLAPVFMSTV